MYFCTILRIKNTKKQLRQLLMFMAKVSTLTTISSTGFQRFILAICQRALVIPRWSELQEYKPRKNTQCLVHESSTSKSEICSHLKNIEKGNKLGVSLPLILRRIMKIVSLLPQVFFNTKKSSVYQVYHYGWRKMDIVYDSSPPKKPWINNDETPLPTATVGLHGRKVKLKSMVDLSRYYTFWVFIPQYDTTQTYSPKSNNVRMKI